MVQRTLDTFGRIDILVNNAAVLVPRGILELPTRHLDLHYRVNIKGPILCIRAVLPTMLQQGQGWIINISSNAAIFPGHGPYTDVRPVRAFMYAVTKAALERLTQGLAVEYQAQGISANVLSPVGRVRTPGNVFGMTPPGGTHGQSGGVHRQPTTAIVHWQYCLRRRDGPAASIVTAKARITIPTAAHQGEP